MILFAAFTTILVVGVLVSHETTNFTQIYIIISVIYLLYVYVHQYINIIYTQISILQQKSVNIIHKNHNFLITVTESISNMI